MGFLWKPQNPYKLPSMYSVLRAQKLAMYLSQVILVNTDTVILPILQTLAINGQYTIVFLLESI